MRLPRICLLLVFASLCKVKLWFALRGELELLDVTVYGKGSISSDVGGDRGQASCARISVISPVTHLRAEKDLPAFFRSIARGTRRPCQIIIRVSSVNTTDDFLFLNNQHYLQLMNTTNIQVMTTELCQNAAQNRNAAVPMVSMPVVAFLDSDDVAGPQWIQVLENTFSNRPDLDFTVHRWFRNCQKPPIVEDTTILDHRDLFDLNVVFPRHLMENPTDRIKWTCCSHTLRPQFTNGHVVFRKRVFETVQQNVRVLPQYHRVSCVTDSLCNTRSPCIFGHRHHSNVAKILASLLTSYTTSFKDESSFDNLPDIVAASADEPTPT